MNTDSIIEIIRQHPKLIITEDYEISVRFSSSRTARWIDEVPTFESNDDRSQVVLRVLHRKRPGVSTTHDLSSESLCALVVEAFAAAELSREDPWFRFPLWRKEGVGPTIERSALKKTDSIPNPPGCLEENIGETSGETLVVRKTEKAVRRASYYGQRFSFQLPVQVGEDTLVLKDEIASSVAVPSILQRKQALLSLGEDLLKGFELIDKKNGPVVFSGQAMAQILKCVSTWFYADRFQAGTSPLAPYRREGRWRKVFSPEISISDDPTLAWGEPREFFDAEGSLCSKTRLVEEGMPVSLLYDSFHAAKDNRLSTANLWIPEGEFLPRITASNFFIEPGNLNDDSMQQALSSGLWVTQLHGFEVENAQAFRARLIGWRVQGGKRQNVFVSQTFSIDAMELLRRVRALTSECLFVGSQGAPSILFENLP